MRCKSRASKAIRQKKKKKKKKKIVWLSTVDRPSRLFRPKKSDFSSCTYAVQWAYGIPMCVSICVSVYPSTFTKCFFSNMPWWIFLIRGYNDHQLGDNRVVQEFGVNGHLGVIWNCCSNMLKTLLGWRDPWREVPSRCSGIFDCRSSWGLWGHCWSLSFQFA